MLYRLDGVRVRLGGDVILEGAQFQHNAGEHLALVGRNGSGKTTLLRLLAGELEAEHGRVHTAGSLSIARLRQHFTAAPGTTVVAYAMAAFARVAALEEELDAVAAKLQAAPADPELLERLQDLQLRLEAAEPYRREAEARTALAALGLEGELQERPVEALSGGQRTRLALARALLEPADLLLLDEPTNHLDLVGAQGLGDLLARRRGALLVATHDRALIDRVAEAVVEVEGGRLRRWPGGYDRYREAKASAEASQLKAWERQQEEVARTEDFIRRNIVGQKTKQAQARRRQLEKLERVEAPAAAQGTPDFEVWREVERSGEVVASLERVAAGYGSTSVLDGVDLVLRRGERVALVGANGSGKTTLLRVLAGRLPPRSGRAVLGHRVLPGWYDQELADLPAEGEVLDAVWQVHPSWNPTQVRGWAARFGFSGEEVELPVAGLSGGERGRLALARILAARPNLLILDEPTNHLDLPTCEALEEALTAFPGTVVLVSHDRRLVERLATRIVLVRERGVEELADLESLLGRLAGSAPREEARPADAGGRRRSPLAEEERRLRRDVERLTEEVGRLEAEIERRHRTIGEAEAAMADRSAWTDAGRLRDLQLTLEQSRDGLEELEERWAETGEDLEALSTRLEQVREELGSS